MIPLDDAPAAGGRRAAVREREEAVVAALRSLGTGLDGEPDPAFRMATRARLVAMAAVRTPEPAPAPRSLLSRLTAMRPEPARSPVRRRLTAGLAGAALAVTALATLVAVATGASPGDPLYGLKRGAEQTQLALSGSDRGLTLLTFARTRLTELGALTGTGNTGLVVETLQAMDDQTARGTAALTTRAVDTQDPATARRLATWGSAQSAGLAAVRGQLPAGAGSAADQAAALLTRVTDRGTALAAALQCSTGPAVGGTDPLGPVPLTCAAPAAQAGGTTGSGSTGTGTAPGTTGTPGTATSGGTTGTGTSPTGTSPTGTGPTSTGPTGTGATGTGSTGTGGAGSVGTGSLGTGSVGTGSGTGGLVPSTPGLPTTGLPSTGLPGTSGGSPLTPVVTPPPPSSAPPSSPVPIGIPPLPGTAPSVGSGTSSTTTGTTTGKLPGVSVCVHPLDVGSC